MNNHKQNNTNHRIPDTIEIGEGLRTSECVKAKGTSPLFWLNG